MDLAIWIILIVLTLVGIVFALLTSVTKWSDKMVDKYKEEKNEGNNNK